MNKRSKIVGLILGGLILGVGIIVFLQTKEPCYQDRTLRSWLEQRANAPWPDAPGNQEACKAIRAIGAERALPHLLRMAEARDGPIRNWIIRKQEHWKTSLLKLRRAEETQRLAFLGFTAFGTNGAPAVPRLTRLMEDTNYALGALACLTCIGKPAEAPICMALTNADQRVRCLAVQSLREVTEDFAVYLDRIEGPLNDPDAQVRYSAVYALGSQKQHADKVVPLLIRALKDPDPDVSCQVPYGLGSIGTNDLRAFEALRDAAETWNAPMAGVALRSLALVDPDRAAPVVARWLQSKDESRRAEAVRALRKVRGLDAETLTALKTLLTDPNVEVRVSVRVWLSEMRREARKADGTPLSQSQTNRITPARVSGNGWQPGLTEASAQRPKTRSGRWTPTPSRLCSGG
jgi:HEAT repeat protein